VGPALDQPRKRGAGAKRRLGELVASHDFLGARSASTDRMGRVQAAHNSLRGSKSLADRPHPRRRIEQIEDGVLAQILDRRTVEREGGHRDQAIGPEHLGECLDHRVGSALDRPERGHPRLYEGRVALAQASLAEGRLDLRALDPHRM